MRSRAGSASIVTAFEAAGAHLVNLIDNFRSRADILSAVETIADGRGGISQRSLVRGTALRLRVRGLRRIDRAPPAYAIEAQWVARRIVELCAEQFRFEQWPCWCATPR